VRGWARFALAGLGLGLLAAGAAAAVVLASGSHREEQTPQAYLDRVSEICETYGRRLDEIPPPDIASPASVLEAVEAVLPIVQEELAEVRAIAPPASLRPDVVRFLELSDRTVAALRRVRAEALERDLYGAATALTRFGEVRDRAQAAGRRVGYRC
jgi:hypothetical protein